MAAEQNRPASPKDAPDPSDSYERSHPENEAGMGRLDNNGDATPSKVPDRQNQTVSNVQDPSRQINAEDDVKKQEKPGVRGAPRCWRLAGAGVRAAGSFHARRRTGRLGSERRTISRTRARSVTPEPKEKAARPEDRAAAGPESMSLLPVGESALTILHQIYEKSPMSRTWGLSRNRSTRTSPPAWRARCLPRSRGRSTKRRSPPSGATSHSSAMSRPRPRN